MCPGSIETPSAATKARCSMRRWKHDHWGNLKSLRQLEEMALGKGTPAGQVRVNCHRWMIETRLPLGGPMHFCVERGADRRVGMRPKIRTPRLAFNDGVESSILRFQVAAAKVMNSTEADLFPRVSQIPSGKDYILQKPHVLPITQTKCGPFKSPNHPLRYRAIPTKREQQEESQV